MTEEVGITNEEAPARSLSYRNPDEKHLFFFLLLGHIMSIKSVIYAGRLMFVSVRKPFYRVKTLSQSRMPFLSFFVESF